MERGLPESLRRFRYRRDCRGSNPQSLALLEECSLLSKREAHKRILDRLRKLDETEKDLSYNERIQRAIDRGAYNGPPVGMDELIRRERRKKF
jgi:hypothetical protein